MIIRKFRAQDTREVAKIIKETFQKYNHADGSKEAIRKYVERFEEDKLSALTDSLQKGRIVLIAEDNGRIMGVVRGDENRVSNLFVDGRYHGRGIGRRLIDEFEKKAREFGSDYINIKSSLYAVPFYQHMGYTRTTGIRKAKRLWGIKYQPMIKRLK